jgi:hypothetical protein
LPVWFIGIRRAVGQVGI